MSNSHHYRKNIQAGLEVDIVLKQDQPTGKLTHGVVKDILTSKNVHPRGIKVRLTSGQVGRVQVVYQNGKPSRVVSLETGPSETEGGQHSNAAADDFDNFI